MRPLPLMLHASNSMRVPRSHGGHLMTSIVSNRGIFDSREFGLRHHRYCGERIKLSVCESNAGFYIGTLDPDGSPVSRESEHYYPTHAVALAALTDKTWEQKLHP